MIPLYEPEPADAAEKAAREKLKPLTEVAYLTIRALEEKNAVPKLKATLDGLIEQTTAPPAEDPDKKKDRNQPAQVIPAGTILEQVFRDAFREVAAAHLTSEELENIFPAPPAPVQEVVVKRVRRRSSVGDMSRSMSVVSQDSSL